MLVALSSLLDIYTSGEPSRTTTCSLSTTFWHGCRTRVVFLRPSTQQLGFVPSPQDQYPLESWRVEHWLSTATVLVTATSESRDPSHCRSRILRLLLQVQHRPTMPWLQPPPCMPALPAKAPNDTMSDARWQGYYQPSLQEGDLMVSMPSHSGDMLLVVSHRSEPTVTGSAQEAGAERSEASIGC